MKKFLVASLVLISAVSQARSARVLDVAPELRTIEVASVATEGEILSTRRRHPFSEFLIGIPVVVNTKNACTSFVGQNTKKEESGLQVLSVIGASSPLATACIAVVPEPVNTQLTFRMNVLTGGIVMANPIQTQTVQIMPLGLFKVTLDMSSDKVSIEQLMPARR